MSEKTNAAMSGLTASLGSGVITVNGYEINLSEAEDGHVLTVSRGSEVKTAHIKHGEKGDKGDEGKGISGAYMQNDRLTLTFSDGTVYTTPSLKGEKGDSAWEDITGKPSSFPPDKHSHGIDDVSGLNTRLKEIEDETKALEAKIKSPSMENAAYHLGFYLDGDGDVCQSE